MGDKDKTVLDGNETVYESETTFFDATIYDASVNGDEKNPADNSEIKNGNIILDTYQVNSDAINGGMGSVWRVHHNNWNVDLAMKRPLPKLFSNENVKKNYILECETWINLGLHPNIVSCYYVREIYGIPTIFSEWMNGGSLEDLIKSEKLYEGNDIEQKKRILDIAIQFARGLNYAHQAGLIHQDVKPANLMMTKAGEAKVTDFGLAKAIATLSIAEDNNVAEEGATIFSESGGYTPAYCSMEQMDGKVLTRRTDIYSWAVSVLEMYIGKRMWVSGVVAGLNCREYFGNTRVSMPETMKDLLVKCLDSEPDNRPQNFDVIEAELIKIYRTETESDYPRPDPMVAAETADSLNNRALSFLDLGKTIDAERLFDKALTLDRNNINVIFNRLLLLWRTGKMNNLEIFSEINSSKQMLNSSEFDYLQAQVYLESGIGDKALELLEPLGNQFKTDAEYIECVNIAHSCIFDKNERPRYDKEMYRLDRFACSEDKTLKYLKGKDQKTVLENTKLPPSKQTMMIDIPPFNAIEACFSEDGKYLAVVNSLGYVVQIFDTATGRLVKKSASKYSAATGGLRFSGQGRYLVSFSVDKTACICDVKNNFKMTACLKFDEVPYGYVAVSPDGKMAVAGFNFGKIATYDVSTGEKIRDYRVGINNVVFTEISPNKEFAVCCCKDGIVHIIRLSNGQCVYSLDRFDQNPKQYITEAVFSPDGRKLICLSSVPSDGRYVYPDEVIYELPDFSFQSALRLAKVKDSELRIKETNEFESNLLLAKEAFSDKRYSDVIKYLDKARSVNGMQYDKRICELNEQLMGHANCVGIRSSWLADTFEIGPKSGARINKMDVSSNGLLIVDCGDKVYTKIIDHRTGEIKKTLEFPGENAIFKMVMDLKFSHDGKTVVGVPQSKLVKVWNAETGDYKGCILESNAFFHPECAAFSPDDSNILISNEEGFSVWDTESQRHIRDVICDGRIIYLRFDQTGQRVMTISKSVALWDFKTGKLIHNYGDSFNTYTVAISPDNKRFVAGIDDGKTALFDIATGNRLKVFDMNGNGRLYSASFIQNGRLVALENSGDEISVWDSETGECVYTFNNFGQHDVRKAVMSPNGQYLFVAHENGTVTKWYIDYIYEPGSSVETVFEESNYTVSQKKICRDCKKPFIPDSLDDDLCEECKKKRSDVLEDILGKLLNGN